MISWALIGSKPALAGLEVGSEPVLAGVEVSSDPLSHGLELGPGSTVTAKARVQFNYSSFVLPLVSTSSRVTGD